MEHPVTVVICEDSQFLILAVKDVSEVILEIWDEVLWPVNKWHIVDELSIEEPTLMAGSFSHTLKAHW
jgi:hypothetical protein